MRKNFGKPASAYSVCIATLSVGSHSARISGHSVCSPSHGVRFDHVKLFVVYHCKCTGVTQMVSCSTCIVPDIARLYICHCLYIMSPALPCKSSIQSGNSEQCMLAFIQLLSSSCTLYFVPFHTYVCAYCKCISLVV